MLDTGSPLRIMVSMKGQQRRENNMTDRRKTCDDCEVNWGRKGNIKTIVLCPLHAVTPKLLKALKAVMPLAQTGFSAMSRQTSGQQAILRQARVAIEDAEGDA